MNCCWSREGIVDSRRNEPSTIYIYISLHPISLHTPNSLLATFPLHYTVSLTLDSPKIKKDSSPILIRDILPDPLDSPLACFAIERISSSEKNKKKKEKEDGTSKNKRGRRFEWGKKMESGMDLVSVFFPLGLAWCGVEASGSAWMGWIGG